MLFAMWAAGYAQAVDKVGVAACDDFLTKYEACISSKVPAAQQASFKPQFDQTQKTWSDINPLFGAVLQERSDMPGTVSFSQR